MCVCVEQYACLRCIFAMSRRMVFKPVPTIISNRSAGHSGDFVDSTAAALCLMFLAPTNGKWTGARCCCLCSFGITFALRDTQTTGT